MNPKKLVDYIISKAKVDNRKLKNVEVFENFSFVSVPFAEAETILAAFNEERNGKKPLIEKAKEKSKDGSSKGNERSAARPVRRRKKENN